MGGENGPYWVSVTLGDDDMSSRLWTAMSECERIRQWTVEQMKKRWDPTEGSPKAGELVPHMTALVRSEGLTSQRFSLVSALYKAVSDFNQGIETEKIRSDREVVKVHFPTQSNQKYQLHIESRAVWAKYINLYSRLSTHYGTLYLEEGWEDVLTEQAHSLGVGTEVLPFLWHSIVLRPKNSSEWEIQFNLHNPRSKTGRQKMRKARYG